MCTGILSMCRTRFYLLQGMELTHKHKTGLSNVFYDRCSLSSDTVLMKYDELSSSRVTTSDRIMLILVPISDLITDIKKHEYWKKKVIWVMFVDIKNLFVHMIHWEVPKRRRAIIKGNGCNFRECATCSREIKVKFSPEIISLAFDIDRVRNQ